jgi:ATP-dependent Clp protease ATP-binding subunit ClpC
MINNFSSAVKEVISIAREEAIRLGSNHIGTGHFALGLIKKSEGSTLAILGNGRDLADLIRDVELGIQNETEKTGSGVAGLSVAGKSKFRLFKFSASRPAGLMLNRQAETAIRESVKEANRAKSATVEPEHLILAISKLAGR